MHLIKSVFKYSDKTIRLKLIKHKNENEKENDVIVSVVANPFSNTSSKNSINDRSHGSPMESMAQTRFRLTSPLVKQQVAAGKLKGIDIVKVALMEYTEPSVASMVKACEAEGADNYIRITYIYCSIGAHRRRSSQYSWPQIQPIRA